MEKRLPLAIFLSFLVLFGWSVCSPRTEPATGDSIPPVAGAGVESGVVVEAGGALAGDGAVVTQGPEPDISADSEEQVAIEFGEAGSPGHWRAVFSNRGARLVELAFGDMVRQAGWEREPELLTRLLQTVHPENGGLESGSMLLDTRPSSESLAPRGLSEVLWKMDVTRDPDGRATEVLFTHGPGTGVVFTKRVWTEPGTWRIYLEFGLQNVSAGPSRRMELNFTPAGCVPEELGDRFYQEPDAVAAGRGREGTELSIDTEAAPGLDGPGGTLDVPTPLAFAGVHNKYFALLMRGTDPDSYRTLSGATYRPVRGYAALPGGGIAPEVGEYVVTDVQLAVDLPAPGESKSYTYAIYAGPKDPAQLAADHVDFAALTRDDLMLAFIARRLLWVLGAFHVLTGNWGVAIILLTLCVRCALFPLNRRSQTAMARYQKKMKRVQPRLDESKKKHEKNPEKLRQEQARIMQEEGAFPPLGGCLPIFVQMPVFFALFSALRTSYDLRQAPFFFWMDDLSRPDRLLELGLPDLAFLPDLRYLNVLPILMVVLWVLQQHGMPKPADAQAARMQKMMAFMPIMMGVFLYNYAAGLSLYMITTSGLGIFEQKVIKKLWPIDDQEVEKKKKAGCGPFSGWMENIAEKHREEMKRLQASQNQKQAQARKKQRRRR